MVFGVNFGMLTNHIEIPELSLNMNFGIFPIKPKSQKQKIAEITPDI